MNRLNARCLHIANSHNLDAVVSQRQVLEGAWVTCREAVAHRLHTATVGSPDAIEVLVVAGISEHQCTELVQHTVGFRQRLLPYIIASAKGGAPVMDFVKGIHHLVLAHFLFGSRQQGIYLLPHLFSYQRLHAGTTRLD